MGNGGSTASARLKIQSRTELRRVERCTESREAEEKLRQNVRNKIMSSKLETKTKSVNQGINEEFTTIRSVAPRKPYQIQKADTQVGDAYWTESSSSSSRTEYSSTGSNYPSSKTGDENEYIRRLKLARNKNRRKKLTSGQSKDCIQCQRSNWQKGYTPNEHGTMVHDTVHDADDREAMADALEWMQYEKPISYNNIIKSQRVANGWMKKRIAERHKYTPIPDRPFYMLEKFPELEEYPKTPEDHLKNYNAFLHRLRGGLPERENQFWKSIKNFVSSPFSGFRTPKSKQKHMKLVVNNTRATKVRFPQFSKKFEVPLRSARNKLN